MHFYFSFYSSILLIFFIQGIVFSSLIFKKSYIQSSNSDTWLGIFVLLCSFYLLPWMLGFAGWYSQEPYRTILFYLPTQQVLLIGPTVYFYTQSLLNPNFKVKRKDWLHTVPALVYLGYRLFIFVVDKIILHQNYFYSNGRDKNLDTWYQIVGFVSMVFYFSLSLKYYTTYKKVIFQTLSFADRLLFGWVRKYLTAFLLMQILWLMFFLFYPNWGNFKEKWWYYLSFSTLMYYIGITGYTNNLKALVPFKIFDSQTDSVFILNDKQEEEIGLDEMQNTSTNSLLEEWKIKISHIIEKEQLYLNPELTLLDVAQKLDSNQTTISKMINQGFKINFNDYINNYRVQAAIQLIHNGEMKRQTLIGISMDCGFNSKTTFNRCFKKYTGKSPKEYVADLPKHNV